MISNNLKHNQNLRLFLNTNKEKVKNKNIFLRKKEEQESILQNKLINLSMRPAIKGDDGQVDKRILPFFSVAVILKKISDKKKYKNLNLLNPQKKLIYKIIKLNKKLEKLVESIKKYNLNLNSFKGSKLDFILFLRNNLYFNLKIRFSNILYKIDLIKAVYNSTINNNNSINNNFINTDNSINNNSININNSINNNNSIKLSPLERLERIIAEAEIKNKKNSRSASKKKLGRILKKHIELYKKNKKVNINMIREAFSNINSKESLKKKWKPLFQKKIGFLKILRKKTFLENIVMILNNYSKLMKYRNLFPNSSIYNSGVGFKKINHLFIYSNKRLLKPKSLIKNSILNNKSSIDFFKEYLKNEQVTNELNKTGEELEFNNAIQLFCKAKETEIKYLLFNLNNLIKKIEYIINIININETFLKKIEKINSSVIYNIKNEINNNLNSNIKIKSSINKQNFPLELESNINDSHNSNNFNSACSEQDQKNNYFEYDSYGESLKLADNYNKTDLYLQISKGLNYENDDNNFKSYNCAEDKNWKTCDNYSYSNVKAVPENIIKIEETIKTITNDDNKHYIEYNSNVYKKFNSSYASPLKDKGILTKNFDWKIDPISVNTNPVNVLYFNNNMNKPIINQYLKSMSIYNMISNGTIMYFSNIIGYNFYNKNLRPETQNIYKLLYSSFRSMYCLISKPVFIIKSNKIIIQLFYFLLVPRILKYKKKKKYSYIKKRKGYVFFNNKFNFLKRSNRFTANNNTFMNKTNFNFKIKFNQKLLKKFIKKKSMSKRKQLLKLDKINLINLYPLKFKKLCEVLNNFFKKPVELDLIRLHYPYNDSNILVRLLAFMINKIKIRRITRKLFKNAVIKSIKKNNNKDKTNIIPAFLSGLTIKVAGRLMKYKVIPRKTVKIVRRGSSSIGKINYTDSSRYTNKNRRGAFTILIKSGQNFF